MRQKCTLTLSSNQMRDKFEGELIGAPILSSGELVFTTGMVGYSEAITDPSYFGQILVFTYPLIGNYGIPELPTGGLKLPIPRGFESDRPQAAAVIVAVDCPETFHWNSLHSLDNWLSKHNIPGIVGLDTRHLVHQIRAGSNLLAKVTPEDPKGSRYDSLHDSSISGAEFFQPGNQEILSFVSSREVVHLGKGRTRIGVIDCGVKWNILRQLIDLDCEAIVVPWDYDFSKIDCDAWLISNGPGDPKKTGNLVEKITTLLSQDRPILGICLGHQLLSLAAGASTIRMPHGHRSHNQPVYEVGTRRGYITSQNHGYEVSASSLTKPWAPWFLNVNDESVEGIKHAEKPFMSVQFHPEAAGGPRDTGWILERFVAGVYR